LRAARLQRKKERENASAFRALSKRGERERTRRGIKNVSSLAKRANLKKVLCCSHVAFIHRLFGRKEKKNSLSSRFSVVLTDIYLSHHHRVVSIFPLLTRARTQTKAGASEKKNARERGFDTWKTTSLARKCTRARRVPFAFPSRSQKQNQTHAKLRIVKSR
jgi:hypothetical protein